MKGRVETLAVDETWVDVFKHVDHKDPQRILWKTDKDEAGIFWAAEGDGIVWFSDGRMVMANISRERVWRFWKRGLEKRFLYLGGRYFKGIPPVGKGDTVINFGANVGELCVQLSGMCGADVIAVEPDPIVRVALLANAELYGFQVAPFAAWKENCKLTMHLAPGSADTSAFGGGKEITVTARTIDSLAPGGPIKLICGDAEGAEPEVLMGATETLERTEYVSLCCSAERNGENTLDDCEELLKAHGFEILSRQETSFCQLIGRRQH